MDLLVFLDKRLLLLAVLLNFCGYVWKHKTRLDNEYIPIFITILSILVSLVYGYYIKKESTLRLVFKYGIFYGWVVASLATHGWGSVKGIKTIIYKVIARFVRTYLTLTSLPRRNLMEDKWKKWKRDLLIDVLTTGTIAALMLLICIMANASMWQIIDNIVLSCLVSSVTISIWDVFGRFVKEPKTLTRQYWIHFAIEMIAITSFTLGYMSMNWTISILAFSITVMFIVFNVLSVKYAWLPSILSASDQYISEWETVQKTLEGKNADEIKDILKDKMRFFLKGNTLSGEPDLTSAVFRDNEDNAISYTTASNSNNFSKEELMDAETKINILSETE